MKIWRTDNIDMAARALSMSITATTGGLGISAVAALVTADNVDAAVLRVSVRDDEAD